MVSKGLHEALQGQQQNLGGGTFQTDARGYGPPPPVTQGARGNQLGPGLGYRAMCIYCGIPGCRARSCPVAAEDVSTGLICQDAFKHIILPGGGEPPQLLPGNCMRDRVHAWHNQNPGQKAQGALGHMLYMVASNIVEDCSERMLDKEREVLGQHLAMVNDQLNAKRRTQHIIFNAVKIPA